MKYECIKPILLEGNRIRVGAIVDAAVAEVKPDYFASVDPDYNPALEVDQPMTISDIAKAKQYKAPHQKQK